ncbi:MAG: hypothetical protein PHY02_05695 [Phycisphaerae bacterium]|nr:hypothetical protein [Phycisphaerae bacterium]
MATKRHPSSLRFAETGEEIHHVLGTPYGEWTRINTNFFTAEHAKHAEG